MSVRAPALPGGHPRDVRGRHGELPGRDRELDGREHDLDGRHRDLRGRLLVAVWVVVPTVCLLLAGLLGTHLDDHSSVVGTVAAFALLLVGCPLIVLALSRALLRSQGAARAESPLRVRRPQLHQMLPPALAAAPRPATVSLGARRRAVALGVLSVMCATSLATWTAVPLGWLWVGSQLASTSRPELEPYLLILVGIPLTMAACVKLLYRLDTVYGRITRRELRRHGRAAWLKSLSAERQRRPTTAADDVMYVSVVIAVVGLLLWFMVLAPHHSLIDWYMD
jgi:hypothetical protein